MSAFEFFHLGLDHTFGKNGKLENLVLGMEYYKKAADLGFISGMVNYGVGLLKGVLRTEVPEDAIGYLKRATDLGSADALCLYLCEVDGGSFKTKDFKEAMQ
jgi:TPR repeat protein